MTSRNYNTVFIDLIKHNWILEILGNDIYQGMESLGYKCRKGTYEEYGGEDISFHMWWGDAMPHKEAKINAVFITHTDDAFKEFKLVEIKDEFDFYFCMSPEDKQFLLELGYEESKVFGFNLPVRNTYIRPITIGIFSRCYPDNRKNEQWLYNFCCHHPESKLVDFVFIGAGWGEFVNKLSLLDCSFQWHNVSRCMPYEYMYQQLKMTNLDFYIYMGMDGGAMGSYDAYAMGVSLCITDDGFHKGIPDVDYLFKTEEEFFKQLLKIVERQQHKLEFFSNNSIDNYVKKIVGALEGDDSLQNVLKEEYDYSIKEKRRSNYYKRKISRKIVLYLKFMFLSLFKNNKAQ